MTTIEWVQGPNGERGMSYNPIRGCSRISPGCGGGGSYSGTNGEQGGCYAEAIAARFSDPGQPFHGFAERTAHGPRWTRKVALLPALLDVPLRRRKPTTWFLSMSDLFHESLKNEEIAAVVGVMAACPQHVFQVLTKRAERLPKWHAWVGREDGARRLALLLHHAQVHCAHPALRRTDDVLAAQWPLPNLWLGVSVEDRARKTRIDHLRQVPAAVRFLSLEPLLEDLGELDLTGIHQAIVGAESGHGARPMHDDWVRRIRDQAKAQGVAFFLKQKLDARGHKVSLPMLDGRQWAEMPVATS